MEGSSKKEKGLMDDSVVIVVGRRLLGLNSNRKNAIIFFKSSYALLSEFSAFYNSL